MNTADLKAYAPKARRDFIAAVTKQAQKYGVTESIIHAVEINGDVCVVNGKPFPANMAPRIKRLAECVERLGFNQTMEQVAYSWFNRLIAIRYMELHDYLGHGRRVLSHPEHPTGFQILEECTDLSYGNDGDAGQLPHLTHEKVVELKLDGTKDEELYRELLLAQCHALHTAMPFLFEPVDDETELLLPENLTKTDSLIHDLITDLAESDWDNIEVIGWLYQFYISEKKDQVIGKVVKSEDIPAATQLFTPNWIVKYMVQNSLGAQWLATYPESPLKEQMEYYIEPAEQTDEVNAQLKEITPTELNPEELTLIDPASGSGHILVEAYDLFKAIYLERGYRQRDIAQHILEKNLFGLDIDQRAAQLTGFALMMKGREDDRRLFERGVQLNVMAMVDSTSLDVDTLAHGIDLSQLGLRESLTAEDLTAFKDLFEHATTFGSLIQVSKNLAKKLPALKQLSESNSQDMFVKEVLEHLVPLVKQAEILAVQYDSVVANPPYMGMGGMNKDLKTFIATYYPSSKIDIYGAFIERTKVLASANGYFSLITMHSWLFVYRFTQLRSDLLNSSLLSNLMHLGGHAFPEISGEVVQACAFVFKNCSSTEPEDFYPKFIRALEHEGDKKSVALNNSECIFSRINQGTFLKLPGKPVMYWAGNGTIQAFLSGKLLESVSEPRHGMVTSDNERFVRLWHEISVNSIGLGLENRESSKVTGLKWFPYNKGGSPRKWYGNTEYVVNWENDGEEIIALATEKYGSPSRKIQSPKYYFKNGITWSAVSMKDIAFRSNGVGFLFDSGGSSLFFNDNKDIEFYLGILNSSSAEHFMRFLSPTININAGDVARIPLPEEITPAARLAIETLVEECSTLFKEEYNILEEYYEFEGIPLGEKLSDKTAVMIVDGNSNLYVELLSKIDILVAELYGINSEVSSRKIIPRFTKVCEDTLSNRIASYAIGCMMGRYSLDEPGLIYANSGNEGFDASRYTKFPSDDDGIIPLTDKEWFADDAANRLVEFISVAWDKAHLEENLNFLAANLSPKKGEDSRDTIRRYLCDKFYKDHMQTYKKRPIYWLFSSGKTKAFQCLVYLHRYNESTLARMRTEYVIPLTAKLSSHIDKLENDKGASGSAAEIKKLEKEIKNLHKQQTELTEFDEKLKHYADMRIPLDLDDGVKVNYGKFGDLLAEVKSIHGKKPE
jgi:type II restriction/modification system DNA methylase subunit YeeA